MKNRTLDYIAGMPGWCYVGVNNYSQIFGMLYFLYGSIVYMIVVKELALGIRFILLSSTLSSLYVLLLLVVPTVTHALLPYTIISTIAVPAVTILVAVEGAPGGAAPTTLKRRGRQIL